MSRATALERIEKLRVQLEEAEAKAAEVEAKKEAVEAEKVAKKRDKLKTRISNRNKHISDLTKANEEDQKELDSLPEEPVTPQLAFDEAEPDDVNA